MNVSHVSINVDSLCLVIMFSLPYYFQVGPHHITHIYIHVCMYALYVGPVPCWEVSCADQQLSIHRSEGLSYTCARKHNVCLHWFAGLPNHHCERKWQLLLLRTWMRHDPVACTVQHCASCGEEISDMINKNITCAIDMCGHMHFTPRRGQ